MGCSDNDSRFSNTLTLANWYYEHLKTVPLFESSKLTPDGDPLIARASDTDWTDKTVDVTVADANATASYFDLEGDISLKVDTVDFSGDVQRGDHAGTLALCQGETELASVELVAAEEVRAPSPLEWLLVQFDRFTRFFTGEPGIAETEVIATTPKA